MGMGQHNALQLLWRKPKACKVFLVCVATALKHTAVNQKRAGIPALGARLCGDHDA
jgi:hypothetical protein